jgi:hypothetical protein
MVASLTRLRDDSVSVWMGLPPTVMLPLSGFTIPARQCGKDDFPEPEGPISATRSEALIVRSTPSRAGVAP